MNSAHDRRRRRRRMVQIRPPPRVHVRHQVEHAVALQHTVARRHRNVVTGLHADLGIDFDVRVNHDHVTHLARPNVVHATDAVRLLQRAPNGLNLLLVDGTVHQVVQGVPAKSPVHPGHHEANNQGGNRVKNRVTGQVADDADSHHQR